MNVKQIENPDTPVRQVTACGNPDLTFKEVLVKVFGKVGLAGNFLWLTLLTGCVGGGGGYYAGVGYGPPAPLVEGPYGIAPGTDYAWTPGFYDWDNGGWAWRHGEWRRRPHEEDRWVAPNWEHRGRGYRYRPGGWQHGNRFHH